ncbi:MULTISPECIES: N-acetylglutamate synthase, CG3035 family [Mycobacteriaceae]|uniref:N-acetyltransferase GCN5 n=1 Tax=Mycolicibacterium neoaurum VKM Ac-1815D TaxID=700508 RepID=V5X984_MYCNE|nr:MULTISPECIES: GNAT family N-acetyltransferase [Mycobacteriaceae]AHC23979.1 GCN5 family acetyltransferase [Mycolicibacterium neoaurum VKM Ac-1815D]AMO04638.1 GCN5 family acetyltransferase [Mycolicibacterium neoaurum]AXK77072.1 GNAT family N-acetyltransferase [Mycolicibacterium neoaurum]KJQ51752.1 GCN5 family acetyltransferase [Mycolicibacterium neoaurum]KUM10497.1 GCN5 family acetyltransferase [Mycolicibacterium neoaurum]
MPFAASRGSRVSLRYRTSEGLTDVVGHLEALTPTVIVRPKSGDDVAIDPADVVSVRELSHRPVRNSEIRALEHAAALAWPGTEQHWQDGWLLRAGSGHTSRANSAVPLLFSSSTEALSEIVSWYAGRGLRPWLALPERLLPIKAPGVKPTRVLVHDLSPTPRLPAVSLAAAPDEHWLRIYERDVPPDILTAVIDGTVTFATVGDAVGRGAVTTAPEGTRWLGVSCVRVAESARRQGLAREVFAALSAWGAEQGATRAYVQVLEDNAPARALYESLGFALHHRHRYVRADSLVLHA